MNDDFEMETCEVVAKAAGAAISATAATSVGSAALGVATGAVVAAAAPAVAAVIMDPKIQTRFLNFKRELVA